MTTKLKALAPVQQMYDEITQQQKLVDSTLSGQPQARAVIDHLNADAKAAGPEVTFTNVTTNYTGIPQQGDPGSESCPDPDPFSQDLAIGCLTFSATAASREQVSALLVSLEADDFFVGPYVTSTTVTPASEEAPESVSFSGSAGISINALQSPLTEEEIAKLLQPKAKASASPAPGAEEG
jgi:hypothetical protein